MLQGCFVPPWLVLSTNSQVKCVLECSQSHACYANRYNTYKDKKNQNSMTYGDSRSIMASSEGLVKVVEQILFVSHQQTFVSVNSLV